MTLSACACRLQHDVTRLCTGLSSMPFDNVLAHCLVSRSTLHHTPTVQGTRARHTVPSASKTARSALPPSSRAPTVSCRAEPQ